MSIFGEIRSLLEGGLQEPGRRIHLLTLLELTQRKDPALYAETVAPYLDGLHYAWPAPFHECKSLTRARQLRALLPRVPLKLSLHSPPPQRDMVRPAQPLAHISHLSLDLTTTTAPSLHDLFGTLKSAHIQHLSLQRSDYAHQGLPEEMAHALARTPLPGLCELDMQQCCMGDAAAHIFAAQASWPRLTRLLLNNPGFRSGGLRALSGASFFPQLEHLRLSCTLPYTPGAAAHTPPDEAPEMCAAAPGV